MEKRMGVRIEIPIPDELVATLDRKAREAGLNRAVFDCMIFFQGAARRRSPAGIRLSLAKRGLIELCASEDVFREVADVLSRPRVRAKFAVLRPEFVKDYSNATRHDHHC